MGDKARIALMRAKLKSADPRALLRGQDIPTASALRGMGFSSKMIDRFFRSLVGGIQLDPSLSSSRRMFDIIFRTLATGDSAVPAKGMGQATTLMALFSIADSKCFSLRIRKFIVTSTFRHSTSKFSNQVLLCGVKEKELLSATRSAVRKRWQAPPSPLSALWETKRVLR